MEALLKRGIHIPLELPPEPRLEVDWGECKDKRASQIDSWKGSSVMDWHAESRRADAQATI